MPKRSSPAPTTAAVGEDGALAVSYLRVSTNEQVQRGCRDEGFSLPTQREANQRKAGGSPAFPGGSVGRRRLLAFPLSSLTPTVELHHLVGH